MSQRSRIDEERLRKSAYGDSPERWVALLPSHLKDDIGIGLGAIIHAGRHGFQLEGPALIDFIRRALYALVMRGAKPRHWGTPEDINRDIPLHYGGNSDSEIVEGVIADWLKSGGGEPRWGDFWFELPKRPGRR